jgi:hypothetical protein
MMGRLAELRRILKNDPDRRFDLYLYDWNWPEPITENYGEGRYIWRDGDWVRP